MADWDVVSEDHAPSSSGGWDVTGTDKFKFSPKAMAEAQKKPGSQVVMMKPDEYLALTPDMPANAKTDRKGASLKASLDKGDAVDEIPSLDVMVGKDGAAKVTDQDGRHRAQFAKENGIDLIPVRIARSGDKSQIKTLAGMRDGSQPMAWDFKPVQQDAPARPQDAPKQPDKLPRWDIIGDIGRDAKSAAAAAKHDFAMATPSREEWQAVTDKNNKQYGPVGGFLANRWEALKGVGNALKLPLDALGVAASPITGTAHALGGSLIASAVEHGDPETQALLKSRGIDPKRFGDEMVDLAVMAGGPESGTPIGANAGRTTKAVSNAPAATNSLKQQSLAAKVANLKPGAAEAHDAGYVLPPTSALQKPGIGNSIASGWGGKVKLQQGASARNQEVTNGLAAEALGLPKDTVLTDQVFKQVRATASKAYKAVSQAVPEITVDPTFQQNIAGLGGRNSAAGQQFPGVIDNPELDTMISNMSKVQKFTPDAGLEVVRKLRSDAKKNMGSQDPNKASLGVAQRKAADEIDELIDRELARQLPAGVGLVDEYRAARQLLAKSYDVEGATNVSTGDVSAKGMARLANRGRPLTGQLKTIADAANAFPKALQNPAAFGGDEPYSALDAFAAAGSVAAGKPEAALTILGRPLVRNALLSKLYQDKIIPDLNQVAAASAPPPSAVFINNAPLPGLQNNLARGIYRAAHVNGLRAMMFRPQPQPVSQPQQGQ